MHESPQPMVSANAERVGPEPKRRKKVLVNEVEWRCGELAS